MCLSSITWGLESRAGLQPPPKENKNMEDKNLENRYKDLDNEYKGFRRFFKIMTWVIGFILGFLLVNWVLVHISISVVHK